MMTTSGVTIPFEAPGKFIGWGPPYPNVRKLHQRSTISLFYNNSFREVGTYKPYYSYQFDFRVTFNLKSVLI